MSESLESVIRRYVILGKKSPKGYEVVKCASCNDYKTRGGFKFEGESVHYQCFNCSLSIGYNPAKRRHSISKKFKEALISFGIPEAEIDRAVAFNFFHQDKASVQLTPEQKKLIFPSEEVRLPRGCILVTSDDSPWCEVGREYLRSRALDPSALELYVTDEETYAGRLIIPYTFRGKVVYWQGRAMDSTIEPRFKNPVVEKDNIFYNMDEIYRPVDAPLFVVEGPTDAMSIGEHAVALAGSNLTEFHYRELKRAALRRKVVFVIDKNVNGYKLGHKVLAEDSIEWYVTVFPDNVTDANDALQKFGKLWLTSHLASSPVKGFEGKLLLEMKCSKK